MKLFIITAAVLALAGPGMAQEVSSTSGATSGSSSDASSQSGSLASAGIVQNHYNSGTSTIKNVPAVAAPGIITAYNCAQAVSAGAAGAGFGISLGGTYVDKNCERISQAAALNSLVGANAAVVHMAAIPEVCVTLRATGHIPASSLCGEKPATTPSTRSASTARPVARDSGYEKCQKDGAKVVIRYAYGADKAAAQAACLASLGF